MAVSKEKQKRSRIRCKAEWLILIGFFASIMTTVWTIKAIVPKSLRSDERVISSEMASNLLLERQELVGNYDDRIAFRIEHGACRTGSAATGNDSVCSSVYQAAIFHSGQGMFSGQKGEKIGNFIFQVGSTVLQSLRTKTDQIQLWQLPDDFYNSRYVEASTVTFFYINNGRRRKQIRGYVVGPKKLRELDRALDKAIFASNFTKRRISHP